MSRFISAGTAENPPERDDAWLEAQRELDEGSRRRKEEAAGVQEGGKTLFEVLQANKAAKQEQFEESIRLKNQFRSLDEDEIDFLDSVLESTRAKDAAVRKETTEQLDAFRRLREEAEKAAREEGDHEGVVGAAEGEEEEWVVGGRKRKRRKARDREKDGEATKGLKLRKMSSPTSASTSASTSAAAAPPDAADAKNPVVNIVRKQNTPVADVKSSDKDNNIPAKQSELSSPPTTTTETKTPTAAAGLGLAAYSSDED